jgi:hypothetical protein
MDEVRMGSKTVSPSSRRRGLDVAVTPSSRRHPVDSTSYDIPAVLVHMSRRAWRVSRRASGPIWASQRAET